MKQFKKDIVFFMESDRGLRLFYSELVTNFFNSQVICLNNIEFFLRFLDNHSYYGGAVFIKLSEFSRSDLQEIQVLQEKLSERLMKVFIYEYDENMRDELVNCEYIDSKNYQFIEASSVGIFKALEGYFAT